MKEELCLVCLQPFFLLDRMCILVFSKVIKRREWDFIEKVCVMTFLEQQLQKIKYKQNNSLCVGVAASKVSIT